MSVMVGVLSGLAAAAWVLHREARRFADSEGKVPRWRFAAVALLILIAFSLSIGLGVIVAVLYTFRTRLLMISFAITSLTVLILFPITLTVALLYRITDKTSPSTLLFVGVASAGAMLCLLSVNIIQRGVLRMFPLRLSARRSRFARWSLWLLPPPLLMLGYWFARVAQLNIPTPLGGVGPLADAAILFSLAPIAFLVAAYRAVARESKLHAHPGAVLARPFVVYLRRFSSFADRVGVEAIMKALPADLPLVFLVPRPSGARDWNPWMIGLSGSRIRKGKAGIPVFMSADHETWQASVESLVLNAELIVMDVSEQSSALDWERSLLERLGRTANTITLRAADGDVTQESDANGRVIEYSKSRLWALPRIAGGLVISAVAAAGWASLTPLLALTPGMDPVVGLVFALGMGYFILPVVVLLPLLAWYTYPVMDVGGRRQLRALMSTLAVEPSCSRP